MKILLIGSKGQLGWELDRRGLKKGFDIVACDLPEIDVTDKSALEKEMTDNNCDLVVNASAYTAVDRAEDEVEKAFSVNRDGPGYLAELCAEKEIPLIHISTDYVFNGKARKPYLESDPLMPLGVYGKSKEAGERAVRRVLNQHIIIRTSWVYGVYGNNFVKTMIRLGQENETVRVVSDQFGCPTFAGDLAEAVLKIASAMATGDKIHWGTYHYCGKGVITWYDFACRIFEIAGEFTELKVKKVIPIGTAEYPTPAERPLYSALDCSWIGRSFGINPVPWHESLEGMIKEYLA